MTHDQTELRRQVEQRTDTLRSILIPPVDVFGAPVVHSGGKSEKRCPDDLHGRRMVTVSGGTARAQSAPVCFCTVDGSCTGEQSWCPWQLFCATRELWPSLSRWLWFGKDASDVTTTERGVYAGMAIPSGAGT